MRLVALLDLGLYSLENRMVSFANFTGMFRNVINTGGGLMQMLGFGDIVFIMSHQYALLWLLGGMVFVQKKRALEITMNPRPMSSHRKKRSRLSAKLPVRIMAGIIASDNSELMD